MYKLTFPLDKNDLPSPLLAKYRSADGPALKAALFMLCEGGCADADALAQSLGMSAAVAQRALSFWEEAGLIAQASGESGAICAAPQKTAAPAAARPPLSGERIGELSLRDDAVASLFQEAEAIVGRPLDTLESRMLAEIYVYDKLPVDVVLTVVAYCAPRAKSNRKIIALASRTAAQWSEEGICDSAAVNAHIRLLEQQEKREDAVAEALGLRDKGLSRTAKTSIARWFEEYGYDLDFVRAALSRLQSAGGAVDNPVAYINTVLRDWYNSGYKTVRDTMQRAANIQPETSKARRERKENAMVSLALGRRKKKKEEDDGSGIQ